MRIALYNPPVHHYAGVRYRMNPALGLPILASVLRNDGHEVGVWDLEALGVSPADIANKYREDTNWPDAIGITVTSHGKRGFADTVLALRSAGYDGYIMAGGPHMSLDPQFGLDSGADVVVMGEGESAILRVVREATTGLVLGEPIPIEEVPAPSWDVHFPKPNQYGGNLPVVDRPETITQFSRGCPHACLFCLPADSIVETGDSWETIRDIKVGTLVRTLNGVAEVTAKQIILHDGELVSLKVSGCAEPLEATPDHMIPVIHWGAINQRSAATNVVMRTEWLEAAQWDWVPAGEVAKGDFAIVPYDSVVEDDAAFSDAFCELAGYYISEGHISKSSSRKDYWTMCCTFGSTEMAMAEHFLSLCKEELDLTAQGSVFRNEQNNTIQAQISGRRPIKYINDMFGTGAKNKHIPSGMMRLPVEKQANLLRTMYWGDGHISKKSVGYTTVSPVLARQV